MIPAPLCDHRATVWRFRELTGASLRERTRQWKRVAKNGRVGLVMHSSRERREDTGGGERVTGEYVAIVGQHVNVEEGDVLEVYSGPHAPVNLKVDERDPAGGQDARLVLVPFTGVLAS